MKKIIVIILILSSICAPKISYAYSIQEMRTKCLLKDRMNIHDSVDVFNIGICLGFMSAFVSLPNTAIGACPPKQVTNGQYQDIFLKWSLQNPEYYHYSASVGMARALQEAFPCTG